MRRAREHRMLFFVLLIVPFGVAVALLIVLIGVVIILIRGEA